MKIVQLGVALACAFYLAPVGASAEVPQKARDLLEKRGLDVAVVEAAESELAVPADWVEKAGKERTLVFTGVSTPEQAAEWIGAFNERYPDIKVEYAEGVGAGRAVKPLIAYKAGNLLTDIVTAFGSSMNDFLDADALEPLTDLPALKNVPAEKRDDKDRWTGFFVSNWCMAFNPTRISREEMPKTWEELVKPEGILAGGRVGVANRAHLWLVNLWGAKGPEWVKNEFLPAFFNNLKPQLRSEGIDGTHRLAVVGEYDVAFPQNEAGVAAQKAAGSPLEFHCLDIVPQYFSELGMFRNSDAKYSAKILINWLLSTEGQLVRYSATDYVPIHTNLQDKAFVPFGDVIFANEVYVRSIDLLVNKMPDVYAVWNKAWQDAGGKPRK